MVVGNLFKNLFGLAGIKTLHMKDFFRSKWHSLRSFPFQGPKMSRFQVPPLQTALIMDFSPSKSIRLAPYKQQVHLKLVCPPRERSAFKAERRNYTLLTCLILAFNEPLPRQRGQI
jgi:hypothetical protein